MQESRLAEMMVNAIKCRAAKSVGSEDPNRIYPFTVGYLMSIVSGLAATSPEAKEFLEKSILLALEDA